MRKIVVVNNPEDWEYNTSEEVEVVLAKTYLTDTSFTEIKNARVFNLCRSYKYQSTGYYVSLLAEARGHKAIPNVTTIQDSEEFIPFKIPHLYPEYLFRAECGKTIRETE
jgi:hypothetical protein